MQDGEASTPRHAEVPPALHMHIDGDGTLWRLSYQDGEPFWWTVGVGLVEAGCTEMAMHGCDDDDDAVVVDVDEPWWS